jgi:hypothetical protein
METITYTRALKAQLDLIARVSEALAKEEPGKSIEQFIAEIEFVKRLLDEAKGLVAEPV